MNFVPEILKMRNGDKVKTVADWQLRREEIVRLFESEMYGRMPVSVKPAKMSVLDTDASCCAGHARLLKAQVESYTEKGTFSFPLNLVLPSSPGPHPVIALINFRSEVYDCFVPVEEIIDGGFALAVLGYGEITSDDADFSTGLAGLLGRPEDDAAFGKIALWAWALSRCVDVLSDMPEIDSAHIAVAGHSRLGKTALWCAVNDERVFCCCANNSGCAGVSLEKDKPGSSETYKKIADRFPYWFCPGFVETAARNIPQPFDQHMLVAAVAPRLICVSSASLDDWASPYHEQLSCIGASAAWEINRLPGYHGPLAAALPGDAFLRGNVGYFVREGGHYLSRHDWQGYMDFLRLHM